jgi:hypothetical protein
MRNRYTDIKISIMYFCSTYCFQIPSGLLLGADLRNLCNIWIADSGYILMAGFMQRG